MKNKQNKKIIDLYLKSVELIKLMESKKWVFDDTILYSSQMHTIRAIGNSSEVNLTELASKMGISKAGVSKFVLKLQTYKFVEKYQSVDNRKEVYFRLTEKGQDAYKKHEEYSHETFSHIYEMLDEMKQGDILITKNFLEKVTLILENATKTI